MKRMDMAHDAARVAALARECLFPAGCAVCKKTLVTGEDAWYGLCAGCRRTFPVELENRCLICGKPLVSENGLCMRCRETSGVSQAEKPDEARQHDFDRLLPIFPYAGTCRTLLSAYKFGKNRAVGNFLMEKLLEALHFFLEDFTEPALVPVPARHGKIKHEGWDQMEYLARLIEKKNDAPPVHRCLKRLPSQTQKTLGYKERAVNLVRRIQCFRIPPKEIILFDDVYTTGATMNACAGALKQAGAEKVYGICLFHT
ncbi:MAG: double zinc ribbon domain-containing protein [Treponema sp.]|jgi:ComF family protein|nr:double zinc ribbon domain-containing protein [Treponema sp.]